MFLDIAKQFNWVDILVVILLLRIGYVALRNGLVIEFFKILGTVTAIYLSLHYYTALSDWVRMRLGSEKVPLEFLDFLFFVVLAIGGYSIFVVLRSVFSRFIKMEAVPKLDKWGGFILGMGRGVLLVGLVIFMLGISGVDYLKSSIKGSYSGRRLVKIAPDAYSWLWNALASKFASNEKFNKTILKVQEGFTQE